MIVTTAQGTNCDNTSRWAKNLPTSRYNYIASHPCTQIERLHASDKMIGPTWGKITRSVWDGSSDLCGGYGRRLQRSSISRDAPTYFADPIHTFHASTPPPGRVATITRAMPRERIHNESSYVLPGGQSILNVAKDAESMGPTSSKKNAYRRYCHDNMTLLANIVHQDTGRRTPIDWNYEKEGTAGEQLPVQLTTSRTSRIYLNKSPYPADSTIGTRSTTNALTSGRKTGSARSSRSHNNNNNNNNSSSNNNNHPTNEKMNVRAPTPGAAAALGAVAIGSGRNSRVMTAPGSGGRTANGTTSSQLRSGHGGRSSNNSRSGEPAKSPAIHSKPSKPSAAKYSAYDGTTSSRPATAATQASCTPPSSPYH